MRLACAGCLLQAKLMLKKEVKDLGTDGSLSASDNYNYGNYVRKTCTCTIIVNANDTS